MLVTKSVGEHLVSDHMQENDDEIPVWYIFPRKSYSVIYPAAYWANMRDAWTLRHVIQYKQTHKQIK